MAMGIVSEEDFNSELGKIGPSKKPDAIPSPTKIAEVMDLPSKGRGKDNVEVPNSVRNLIGLEALNEGRASALELAKQFGISPSSVSAYTQGAKSTATYDEKPNAPVIDNQKNNVQFIRVGSSRCPAYILYILSECNI